MTIEERKSKVEKLFGESLGILHSKGESYAGKEDTLANFKRNAERMGLSKYQIWAVYFNKHIDSINNAIKYNADAPVDKTEGLHGRILDAITYLSILECLLSEDADNAKIIKIDGAGGTSPVVYMGGTDQFYYGKL